MDIHVINPLLDSRWDELVARHPRASAFHQRGWLEALAQTYGYEPQVLTTASADTRLENGLVFCRISSWMTGNRLVSLPFADHCEPLMDDEGGGKELIKGLQAECDFHHLPYAELRPLSNLKTDCGLQPSGSYWFHDLDITPSLDEIFKRLHKNSFRRKIQRAEQEHLSYSAGRSERFVAEFYSLLLKTRKRHGLLPQPRSWFSNLVASMGNNIQIRLVSTSGIPIAGMLTLQHRSCVVYKYGCSDARFHHLGGMPFLFWKLIEEGKALGVEKIDYGRSDLDNQGLITFKDRLGAKKKPLTYYRYTRTEKRNITSLSASQAVRRVCALLPDTVSSAAGGVFYKHIG